LFFNAARPLNRLSKFFGGSHLESMLLARHQVIDAELEAAIDSGEISQVLEVAAGLSPRGYRFAKRFDHLTYVEADLPEMAEHKRSILQAADSLTPRHRVVTIDALADDGEQSIASVCAAELDPDQGTAIITEGLLTYFNPDQVQGIWKRFGAALSTFPAGLHLTDLHLDHDIREVPGAQLFRRVLNQWTRGAHHTYFEDPSAAQAALKDAGFTAVTIPYASDYADRFDIEPRDQTGRVRVAIARIASR